ncbi:hypothetical protein AHAS_Ahas02G0000900 [Arachis hypogaea]
MHIVIEGKLKEQVVDNIKDEVMAIAIAIWQCCKLLMMLVALFSSSRLPKPNSSIHHASCMDIVTLSLSRPHLIALSVPHLIHSPWSSSRSHAPVLASLAAEANGTASGPSGGGGGNLLASHSLYLTPGLDLSLPYAIHRCFFLAISFSFAVRFLRATRFVFLMEDIDANQSEENVDQAPNLSYEDIDVDFKITWT